MCWQEFSKKKVRLIFQLIIRWLILLLNVKGYESGKNIRLKLHINLIWRIRENERKRKREGEREREIKLHINLLHSNRCHANILFFIIIFLNVFTSFTFPEISSDDDEKGNVRSGGDVWVLLIKNAKPTDSGIYVCEVNSNPIVRSFHKLSGEIFKIILYIYVCIFYSSATLTFNPIYFLFINNEEIVPFSTYDV